MRAITSFISPALLKHHQPFSSVRMSRHLSDLTKSQSTFSRLLAILRDAMKYQLLSAYFFDLLFSLSYISLTFSDRIVLQVYLPSPCVPRQLRCSK